MDERYLLATVRYVEMNPVKAGLCDKPENWPWSSSMPHITGMDDSVVSVRPMLERVDDWRLYLNSISPQEELDAIARHNRTGRPAGNEAFIEKLERNLGRILKKGKPGPKPKSKSSN